MHSTLQSPWSTKQQSVSTSFLQRCSPQKDPSRRRLPAFLRVSFRRNANHPNASTSMDDASLEDGSERSLTNLFQKSSTIDDTCQKRVRFDLNSTSSGDHRSAAPSDYLSPVELTNILQREKLLMQRRGVQMYLMHCVKARQSLNGIQPRPANNSKPENSKPENNGSTMLKVDDDDEKSSSVWSSFSEAHPRVAERIMTGVAAGHRGLEQACSEATSRQRIQILVKRSKSMSRRQRKKQAESLAAWYHAQSSSDRQWARILGEVDEIVSKPDRDQKEPQRTVVKVPPVTVE